mmetsp:Transcript_28340/g.62251  ORF Transcript_28340/g.62251 Transcript_28340/m.62251 type:complete len:326 (-) Transcript_28340:41-1018(-)
MKSSSPRDARAPACRRSCTSTRSGSRAAVVAGGPPCFCWLAAGCTTTSHQHCGWSTWWLAKSRPGRMPSVTSSCWAAALGSLANRWEAAPSLGTGRLWPRDQNTEKAHCRSWRLAWRLTPAAPAARLLSAGPSFSHWSASLSRSLDATQYSVVPLSSSSSSADMCRGVWKLAGSASIQGAMAEACPLSLSRTRYAITMVRSSTTPCFSIQLYPAPWAGSRRMLEELTAMDSGNSARAPARWEGDGCRPPNGHHQRRMPWLQAPNLRVSALSDTNKPRPASGPAVLARISTRSTFAPCFTSHSLSLSSLSASLVLVAGAGCCCCWQ